MKKRILLVNKSFTTGGIQSSMINLANELSKYYDVDLFLFYPEGTLKKNLSSKVRVLDSPWKIQVIGMSFQDVIAVKRLKMLLFWLFCHVSAKFVDNRLCLWMAFQSQPKLSGYDLAIAYHHEQRKKTVTAGFARFVLERVDAREKISWIHYDAASIELDQSFNKKYYAQMDKIVGASESVAKAFGRAYPNLAKKVDYCYNIVNYEWLYRCALQEQSIPYDSGKFCCFSACRLTKEKAIVRAIEAFEKTLKEFQDVVWYIAGEGPERPAIEDTIQKYKFEKQIILLGNQSNPYPYMRNCNLLLNLSFHEAAPVVFLEANALHIPVFCTRTLSAEEMLQNGKGDFICENDSISIRDTFYELMSNRERIWRARKEKEKNMSDNGQTLEKVKEWF